jgi:hypothetical protein
VTVGIRFPFNANPESELATLGPSGSPTLLKVIRDHEERVRKLEKDRGS